MKISRLLAIFLFAVAFLSSASTADAAVINAPTTISTDIVSE